MGNVCSLCKNREQEHFEFNVHNPEIYDNPYNVKKYDQLTNHNNSSLISKIIFEKEKDVEINNLSLDNYDYNNYLPKKEDEEEVTINNKKDDMQFNPEFVKNQFQIQSLCSTHMIDRSYLSKCNWTPNQFKMKTGSNFMKPRVLESIKRNINIINDYLNCHFENIEINKTGFFTFQHTNEYFDFLNFKKKKYFYLIENKDIENKTYVEIQIFILNVEEDIISTFNLKNEFIGCQIFRNGKLFAGKFNDEGKLNGQGIHINKKGNLICGNFENSDLKKGKIYTFDGIIYEGSLKNLKRHGRGQKEFKEGCYEFIGDFENDKRVKGKFTYDQKNEKFKYVRNLEIDHFQRANKIDNPNYVKLRLKYQNKQYFYEGNIFKNAINDVNGTLIYSKSGYPKYEGAFKENYKEGIGKYSWSIDETYSGSFVQNKIHTNMNGGMKEFFNNSEKSLSKRNDKDCLCLLKNGVKIYSVLFRMGDILGYQEVVDD